MHHVDRPCNLCRCLTVWSFNFNFWRFSLHTTAHSSPSVKTEILCIFVNKLHIDWGRKSTRREERSWKTPKWNKPKNNNNKNSWWLVVWNRKILCLLLTYILFIIIRWRYTGRCKLHWSVWIPFVWLQWCDRLNCVIDSFALDCCFSNGEHLKEKQTKYNNNNKKTIFFKKVCFVTDVCYLSYFLS